MDKISEVAAHIKQANGNVCIITGAGASKTANIPTANELIQLVIKKYPHCLNKLSESDQTNYGKVMAELAPAEREQLITPLLEKSGINWGHIALASMIKGNYIKRVLTFNFDQILEKAVSLLGMQLPVYDFGGAPTSDINRIAHPSILHLHGQSHGLVLLNTDEETQKHKDSLHPILKDTVRDHITIVIGYSGETDTALEVINEEYNSHNRLIWMGYNDTPPSCLTPLLEQNYAEYIGGCDFDLTMIKIAQNLNIWPPSIIQNPIQHLLEELNEVQAYPPEEGAEVNVLKSTREKLETFASNWQSEDDPDNEVYAKFMSGHFTEEEINTLVKGHETLSENSKNALSWALILKGIELTNEANILTGEQAKEKFNQAYQKYEQAIKINPDSYETYNNWGTALSNEANILTGKRAQQKFKQANQKYEQAIKINPDSYETYNNWGLNLVEETKTLSEKQTQEKFNQAYQKYGKAIKINPNNSRAYNNWGTAISKEAMTLPEKKAEKKFKQAYQKFKQANKINPNNYRVYNNWGASLLDEARGISGNLAQEKIIEAEKKSLEAKSLTNKGNYNLACTFALTNKIPEALEELKQCKKDGTLPDLTHLTTDPDMAPLRETEKFKELISSLKEK